RRGASTARRIGSARVGHASIIRARAGSAEDKKTPFRSAQAADVCLKRHCRKHPSLSRLAWARWPRKLVLRHPPARAFRHYVCHRPAVSTSAKIARRIGSDIVGSHFPTFDRNTNTGEGPAGSRTLVATENVWPTADHPPRVILPVMPER